MTPAPSPKRRSRISKIDVPSPRRVAAAELLTRLSAFRQAIEDVERRTIPLASWNGEWEAVEMLMPQRGSGTRSRMRALDSMRLARTGSVGRIPCSASRRVKPSNLRQVILD